VIIEASPAGGAFLPTLPLREPEQTVNAEAVARAVNDAVNVYNERLDSMARKWVELLSQEAPSMGQFVELQNSMHHASFYEHAARQVETAFSELVNNLVVRG
jgi:hypothetical protein